jgi:hypothetical protein
MNTKKSLFTFPSLVRTLVGLALAVMLTFVAVPGVSPVGAPQILQPTWLIDPPGVD